MAQNDSLVALLLSGSEKPLIDKIKINFNSLTSTKVVIPKGLFIELPKAKIWYAEGIYAFIFGLFNASLPLIFKCLELGLRKKYETVESKKSNHLKIELLINWAEPYLGNKKELTHGFRILRNLIHEDSSIEGPDALQAIYHISIILNLLFPYETTNINFKCSFCGRIENTLISSEQNFIGNLLKVNCETLPMELVDLAIFV